LLYTYRRFSGEESKIRRSEDPKKPGIPDPAGRTATCGRR
jgi:hypothetical protein